MCKGVSRGKDPAMTNSDKAKAVACKAYQAVANHGKVRSFLLSLPDRSHADA